MDIRDGPDFARRATRPVCWYKVDAADAELNVFCRYLTSTLRLQRPALDCARLLEITESVDSDRAEVLAAIRGSEGRILAADAGWVSVGADHDTSAFAVQTLRRWWHTVGAHRYPDTDHWFFESDRPAFQEAAAGLRAIREPENGVLVFDYDF